MSLFNLKDFLLISPALAFTGAGLLVLTFQLILPKFRLWFSYWIAIVAASFVCLLITANLPLPFNTEFLEPLKVLKDSLAFKDQIGWHPYNALFSLSVSISILLILLLSRRALIHLDLNLSEAYQMILFSGSGLVFFILSNHLIVMFVSLELASLPIFVLAGWDRKMKSSNEAGIKYFLLSVFSIAFFLLGTAFVYGSLGTTDLIQISQAALDLQTMLINPNYLTTGIFLILISLAFKVALFPLHAWVADVYEGSITIVTAFMASLVKIAAVAVMFKVLYYFSAFTASDLLNVKRFFHQTLVWFAIGSMFYGNIAALVQTNLKRIFAYSSIAHAGYMAALFILADVNQKEHFNETLASLFFYGFSYSITTILIFGIIAYLEAFFKTKKSKGVELEDIKGLSGKKPLAAFLISAASLSFAGIPPLVGFYAKFYLLKTLLITKMYWLAIFISINSMIAIYYYARIFFYSYWFTNESSEKGSIDKPLLWNGPGSNLSVLTLAMVVLLLGVLSPPLFSWIVGYIDLF